MQGPHSCILPWGSQTFFPSLETSQETITQPGICTRHPLSRHQKLMGFSLSHGQRSPTAPPHTAMGSSDIPRTLFPTLRGYFTAPGPPGLAERQECLSPSSRVGPDGGGGGHSPPCLLQPSTHHGSFTTGVMGLSGERALLKINILEN